METLEIGRAYNVNHSRKGKFVMIVESQDETWVHGTVVSGVAKATMDYNVKEEGEEISLRKELCTFS